MIKEVEITNFYSFNKTAIKIHPNTNVLIGINGSGKSNFIKVLNLLKEGIAGSGLKKHIIDNSGGFDNLYFKGTEKTSDLQEINISYTFSGKEISLAGNGFNFTDDIIYEISIVKSSSLSNYYINEKIKNNKGFVYLDFKNGIGHLNENVSETSYRTKLVKYVDFDAQELVLREIQKT